VQLHQLTIVALLSSAELALKRGTRKQAAFRTFLVLGLDSLRVAETEETTALALPSS